MKKNLIIIDAQYDFTNVNGALSVPNANIAVQKIVEFIDKHKTEIDVVVFTMDNHPNNHCSFKTNGGIWPEHCIQHTEGVMISPELIRVCVANNINYKVIKKGEVPDKEEYTAFSHTRKIGNATILKSKTDSIVVNSEKFVVCGFAGDYCVKDSIADLISVVGAENIEVYRDGVADIDDGTVFNNFIKENNLTIINN